MAEGKVIEPPEHKNSDNKDIKCQWGRENVWIGFKKRKLLLVVDKKICICNTSHTEHNEGAHSRC